MKTSNHTFPPEASTASEPIELTMDSFQPVESPLQLRMGSRDATKENRLPYAQQDPRSAAHVTIVTPDGRYKSDNIRIDETAGEIIIDADGARILLDWQNVVVYLNPPKTHDLSKCSV